MFTNEMNKQQCLPPKMEKGSPQEETASITSKPVKGNIISKESADENKALASYQLTSQDATTPVHIQSDLQKEKDALLTSINGYSKALVTRINQLPDTVLCSLNQEGMMEREELIRLLKKKLKSYNYDTYAIFESLEIITADVTLTNKSEFIEYILDNLLAELINIISGEDDCKGRYATSRFMILIFQIASEYFETIGGKSGFDDLLNSLLSKAKGREVFVILHLLSMLHKDWAYSNFFDFNYSLTTQQAQDALDTVEIVCELLSKNMICEGGCSYLLDHVIDTFIIISLSCTDNIRQALVDRFHKVTAILFYKKTEQLRNYILGETFGCIEKRVGRRTINVISHHSFNAFKRLVIYLDLEKLDASIFNDRMINISSMLHDILMYESISITIIKSFLTLFLINLRKFCTLLKDSSEKKSATAQSIENTVITQNIIRISNMIFTGRFCFFWLQKNEEQNNFVKYSKKLKAKCSTYIADELKATIEHVIKIKSTLPDNEGFVALDQSIFSLYLSMSESTDMLHEPETRFLSSLITLSKQGHILGRAYCSWLLLSKNSNCYLPDIALNNLLIDRSLVSYQFDNDTLGKISLPEEKHNEYSNLTTDQFIINLFTLALHMYDNPSKLTSTNIDNKNKLIDYLKRTNKDLFIIITELLTSGFEEILETLSGSVKDSSKLWLKGWIYQNMGQYDEAISCFMGIARGSKKKQEPSYIDVNMGVCCYYKVLGGDDCYLTKAKYHLALAINYYQAYSIFTEEQLPVLQCCLDKINSFMGNKPKPEVAGIAEQDGDEIDQAIAQLAMMQHNRESEKKGGKKGGRKGGKKGRKNNGNKSEKKRAESKHSGKSTGAPTSQPESEDEPSTSSKDKRGYKNPYVIKGTATIAPENSRLSGEISFENILKSTNAILSRHHGRIPKKNTAEIDILNEGWRTKLSGKNKSVACSERSDYINFDHKVISLNSHLSCISVTNDFYQYSSMLLAFLGKADLMYANNIELLFDRLGWLFIENQEFICLRGEVKIKTLRHTVISLFILSIVYTVSSDKGMVIHDDQDVFFCVASILEDVRKYLETIKDKKTIHYQARVRLVCRLSNLAHALKDLHNDSDGHSLKDFVKYYPAYSAVINLRDELQTGLEKIGKNYKKSDSMIAKIRQFTPRLSMITEDQFKLLKACLS